MGGLVLKFGGWEWSEGVLGAKRYALQCSRKGGSWVHYDEWSGIWEFLKVDQEFERLMSKKWSQFTKYHDEGSFVDRS